MNETLLDISRQFWEAMEHADEVGMRACAHPDCNFVHIGITCKLDKEIEFYTSGAFQPTNITFHSQKAELFGDTGVVLTDCDYSLLLDGKETTATITITDNLMDGYGITLEELHDQALQNMDTLQPHSFKGMNETVAEMIAVDIARDQNVGMDEAKEMAMQMMPDIPDIMYVLTNDTKVNGAAVILNDDIRQEIAEKVGDFYMLPSSIHETLIIPKDAGMEFKELEQMVQEVNQTQVAPGERLSDHIYEYDAKEHELFRSDRAEERAKQKEEKRDNRYERVSVKEKLAEKKDAVIKMNAGKEHSAPEKKKEAVI